MARKPQGVAFSPDVPESDAVKTVRMVRDLPEKDGGPVEADIHPAEVENCKASGWRVAE